MTMLDGSKSDRCQRTIPRGRFALGTIYVKQGSEGGVTFWKLGAEPMVYT